MQDDYYIEELRRKIGKVLSDKGGSYSPIDAMTTYIGNRMTSDSALFHAMKARESGATTLQVIEAAFFGAFGIKPSQAHSERLSSESQTTES